MLQAGFSRVDISPDIGVQLAGFPDAIRRNIGVHDPLYATTAVLSDGNEAVCLISLDLLWYHKRDVASIRELITKQIGIPTDHIMICCTHTHSGHIAASFGNFTPQQLEAMPTETEIAALNIRIANSAVEAYRRLSPAVFGTGKQVCGMEVGIGGNRRDPINGVVDPALQILAVRDQTGVLLGCVVKYALHPSTMHEDNLLVSADYVGYLRQTVEAAYPDAYLLFLQGTSGDQSNRHTRVFQGFAEAERIGHALGCAIIDLLEQIAFTAAGSITAAQAQITLPLRELPTAEEAVCAVSNAKAAFEQLKAAEQTEPIKLRRAEVALFGAECLASYVQRMTDPIGYTQLTAELPAEVQVIRWNDMAIAGVQGELFAAYGLKLRQASPFSSTMVVTLANGGLPGYVCTEEAYQEGGYEVGSSLLSPEAGQLLTEAAVALLRQIKG